MDTTNNRSLGHHGVPCRTVLDFNRRNPLTTRLNDILGSVCNRYIAAGVDTRHITGFKPVFVFVCRAAVELEVTLADPRSPNFQGAKGNAIPWELFVVVVGNLNLNAKNRLTYVGSHVCKRLSVVLMPAGARRVRCAKRTHLSHTPSMAGINTVGIKLLHYRQRTGGAAYNNALQRIHTLAR